jgi:EAL domain-containing protein (putative c-di-GMP-specific phosphodiesterase class I)
MRPDDVEVLTDDAGRVSGRFRQVRLASVFEPIFAMSGGTVSGARADLRTPGRGGPDLAPWPVLAEAATADELVRLDRLARTVHALNFASIARPGQVLHLSVHPRLIDAVADHHGRVYRRLLGSLGLDGLPVVVELPSIVPGQEARIAPIASSYRRQGFGVAFRPASRRQLEALLATCTLDTLRIDAGRLVRFGAVDDTLRAARRDGISVIVDGARGAFDAGLARALGATHVQGPLSGVPSPAPDLETPLQDRIGEPTLSDHLDVDRFVRQAFA